jgi:hypothetical protein
LFLMGKNNEHEKNLRLLWFNWFAIIGVGFSVNFWRVSWGRKFRATGFRSIVKGLQQLQSSNNFIGNKFTSIY